MKIAYTKNAVKPTGEVYVEQELNIEVSENELTEIVNDTNTTFMDALADLVEGLRNKFR